MFWKWNDPAVCRKYNQQEDSPPPLSPPLQTIRWVPRFASQINKLSAFMFFSFTRNLNPFIQCCGSGDVHAGSRIVIFTHPGSRIQKQQQNRGVKKFFARPYFVPKYFPKLKIIFFLMLKKKFWANFRRIIELFSQKKGLGSEIRDSEKTYSELWI